jgi:hypothetical protein
MSEISVPFLLCIPIEKIADIVQKMDDWQKSHYAIRYEKPFYLEEKQPDVIDISPDTAQQMVDETNREMSGNTGIKGEVK